MAQVRLSNGQTVNIRVTVGTLSKLPDELSIDALLNGLQQGQLQSTIRLMQAIHMMAGIRTPADQWLDQLEAADVLALSQAFIEELERFFRQLGTLPMPNQPGN